MIYGHVSPKGGPGKSTTAINLAASFANAGYKTALKDADDENKSSLEWGGYRPAERPSIDVSGLSNMKDLTKDVVKLNKDHDVVIIDGRPSTEQLTTTIMQLADFLIIPVVPGVLDIWKIRDFLGYYDTAVTLRGRPLPGCFLINRFEGVSLLVKEIQEILKSFTYEEVEGEIMERPLTLLNATMRKRDDYSKTLPYGIGVCEIDENIKDDETGKPVFPRYEAAQQEWETIYKEILKLSIAKQKIA